MNCKSTVFVLLCLLCVSTANKRVYDGLLDNELPYPLPELGMSYHALEPHIDSATLRVHHTGHHQAYTNVMNKALKEWRADEPESKLAHSSIVEILERLSEVPSNYQEQMRNYGGGYVNHIIYWAPLCPHVHSSGKPEGELWEDIEAAFGSFEVFISRFLSAATGVFGSGYCWLVEDTEGTLSIQTTANQDSPLSSGHYPLLVIDMWEHAFYLKHQNKKKMHIPDWFNVICWDKVHDLREFWRNAGKIPRNNKKTEL